MSQIDDTVEDEVVLGESSSDDVRRIRVYDGDGDFVIEVPAGAKVTFGYFNPAASGSFQPNMGGYGREPNVMKQTALRIYERGEKGNQLACFIGVRGFRDEAVKKTSLVQRVVVERRYENDGEGGENWNGNSQRQIVAAPEEIPF
jgi:hypothetical protein